MKFASDIAKLPHAFKHLPNLLNVDFWASMSGQRSFRFEAAGLPVIRYQFSGVRELVLLKAIDLRAWYDQQEFKKPEDQREKITYGNLATKLVHMSEDDIREFCESHPGSVLLAHVIPAEWIYIPAAWIVGEKTNSEEDNFGIKISFLDLKDMDGLRSLKQEAVDLRGQATPQVQEIFHCESLMVSLQAPAAGHGSDGGSDQKGGHGSETMSEVQEGGNGEKPSASDQDAMDEKPAALASTQTDGKDEKPAVPAEAMPADQMGSVGEAPAAGKKADTQTIWV